MDRDTAARAVLSLGISNDAIYRMAAKALTACRYAGGTVIDVGCGSGGLWYVIGERFERYVGIDAVRYQSLPAAIEFHQADLNQPLPVSLEGSADAVMALETIEHLENPRAFVRGLARLARPGGWVLVSTPNQLSLLSLASLAVRKRFAAFQDVHYPAHITALLEVDLRRIMGEAGLERIAVTYSEDGRIALTGRHYPGALVRWFPRALSDNLLVAGRKKM